MTKQEVTDYKRKYNKDNYARVSLYLRPDEKERWQEAADGQKVTLSEFIKMCVRKNIV